ncbi:MAG TPA: hypothetical protein PKC12_01230 [Thiobacillaceae bacterium]|nr:hypothetical protein [Thiobacillaceae bacterium]
MKNRASARFFVIRDANHRLAISVRRIALRIVRLAMIVLVAAFCGFLNFPTRGILLGEGKIRDYRPGCGRHGEKKPHPGARLMSMPV